MIIQICDSLVAALNGGGAYSKAFTARREVLPVFELKDLGSLRVSVIPRNVDVSILTRGAALYEHSIDVAVHKRLTTPIEPEFDTMVAFVFELAQAIRIITIPHAAYAGLSIQPLYLLDDLAQDGLFTSVISAKYRAMQ